MSAVSRIVRKSQASLFWCMRGLPKAKREAIYTLYAFIKHIDYVIDSSMPMSEKEDLLKAWKMELDNIYDKKVPETEIGRKIYKNCMRFKIQKEDFSYILRAALLDFPKPLQAPPKKVFDEYTYGSAIIPIYIMLLIMGNMDERKMRDLSLHFGRAMELTNILKNVKDDAMANHLYIPKEVLTQFGIQSTDPMTVVTDSRLIAVREEIAKETALDFDKAYQLLSDEDQKQTRPLRFILNIYKRYFDIMEKRGFEIMSPKPEIKKRDKIAIMLKTLFEKA